MNFLNLLQSAARTSLFWEAVQGGWKVLLMDRAFDDEEYFKENEPDASSAWAGKVYPQLKRSPMERTTGQNVEVVIPRNQKSKKKIPNWGTGKRGTHWTRRITQKHRCKYLVDKKNKKVLVLGLRNHDL